MRNFILAAAAVALVAPTMIVATPAEARSKYKEWRGKDGRMYCKRKNGTTGLVIGGAVGALAGREIAGRGDKTVGTIIGAAGGALLGREIDKGKRRCK